MSDRILAYGGVDDRKRTRIVISVRPDDWALVQRHLKETNVKPRERFYADAIFEAVLARIYHFQEEDKA